MTFNKERFVNFAKYDLTINKTFFRNMALVTVIGAIGISVAMFFSRYSMWKGLVGDDMEQYEQMKAMAEGGLDMPLLVCVPGSYEHFNTMPITTLLLAEFLGVMIIIFSGCWAHNLRNKQGRIMELTIPATNLEKYAWHSLLTIGGGIVLAFISLLCADAFNALFTWMLCPAGDGFVSLTANCLSILTLDTTSLTGLFGNGYGPDFNGIESDEVYSSVFTSFKFLFWTALLCNLAIYHFGNSVKYKYNIILTYVALYVLEIVMAILFGIGMAFIVGNQYDLDLHPSDGPTLLKGFAYTVGTIFLIITIALPIISFRRYERAQVTSKLNK